MHLRDDVFSYQKEIEFGGDRHNCVLVVQHFLDCDRDRALNIVSDLMNSGMREFRHVAAVREALDGYVQELRDRLSGILNWHRGCHRYDEAALRRRYRVAGTAEPVAVSPAPAQATRFGEPSARRSARVPC